ncbi:RNA-directed DNA polymerase, partial [Salmonella enterica]|nr:RNA-directed DNA polymerase [Salmonella enterica]
APSEILYYLRLILTDDGALPNIDSLKQHLKELHKIGYVELVSIKNELYSITPSGDEKLSANLKKLRDKLRIFLLDKCHKSTKLGLLASTDTKNMDGAPPSLQLRPYIKEVPHPSLSWVRIFEQLRIGSMSSSQASILSKDSDSLIPEKKIIAAPIFYSYKSLNSPLFENNGILTVASCIGLTPRLISSMIKNPDRYYRIFDMRKKSGGVRKISAPRKFMKVTQYWINDYFLNR